MQKILGFVVGIIATLALVYPVVAMAAVTFPINGGTGTSTKPTYGQVLVGDGTGLYNLLATSSLGISTGGGSVSSVFGRTGAVVATTGDYTTAMVTEVTNLYFTAARVLATALTGFSATTGTVTSSDTVLSAIQKLAGNASSYLTNITGLVTAGTNVTITGSGTSGSPYVINSTGGGGSGTVGSGTTGQLPYYAANGTTLTATSSLFLATSGNIGIGTTTPTNLLTLAAGSAAVPAISFGDTGAGFYRLGNGGVGVAIAGVARFGFQNTGNFQNASSNGFLLYGGRGATATQSTINPNALNANAGIGADTAGDVSLITDNAGTATEMERLTGLYALFNGGNVGIGTSTPATKLDVNGTAQIEGTSLLLNPYSATASALSVSGNRAFFGYDGGNNAAYVGAGATKGIEFNVNGSSLAATSVVINTSGYVGIGTSSPQAALSLGSGQIVLPEGTAGAPSYAFSGYPGTGLYDSAGSLVVSTGGAQRITFGVTGGILLNSNSISQAASIVANNASGYQLTGGATSGTVPSIVPNHADTTTGLGADASGNLSLITGATTKLEILNNGNVGIGTTTPAYLLDIAGTNEIAEFGDNANTNSYIGFDGSSLSAPGRAFFGYDSGNGNAVVQGINTKGIEFNVNNATFGLGTAAVLTSAGNFGIGTTTPGSLLSLQGIANFTTATSTFYSTGGMNITNGCYAVNGVCIGAGATYTAGTGLTLTGGAFSVNTSQNISTLSNLTTAGFVQTDASGNLSSAALTSGQVTTALGFTPFGGTNPLPLANGGTGSTTLSGILIGNGTSAVNTLTIGSGLSLAGTTLSASGGYSPIGTTGQFPYFSGTNTLTATSSLFLDTNSNVGVGSTTPFGAFAIQATNGNKYIGNLLFNIASSSSTSNGSLFSISNTGTITSSSTSNNLVFTNINSAIGTPSTSGLSIDSVRSFTADSQGNTTFNTRFNMFGGLAWQFQVRSNGLTIPAISMFDGISGNNVATIGIATTTASSTLTVGGNETIGADYSMVAPTNGLLVEGNVGIGTTSPAFKVDILSTSTPQLGLADGVTSDPQWAFSNTGGVLNIGTTSPTTYATSTPSAIQVTSSATTMMGIATTTPWRTLSVTGTVGMQGLTTAAGSVDGVCINTVTFELQANSSASCTVSSKRFKHDIQYLTGQGLADIMAFKPATFIYNNATSTQYGFIAEDVAAVNPDLVGYDNQGRVNSIDDIAMIALSVKAIQEQQVEIKHLSAQANNDIQDNWQWISIGLLFVWNLYLTLSKNKKIGKILRHKHDFYIVGGTRTMQCNCGKLISSYE